MTKKSSTKTSFSLAAVKIKKTQESTQGKESQKSSHCESKPKKFKASKVSKDSSVRDPPSVAIKLHMAVGNKDIRASLHRCASNRDASDFLHKVSARVVFADKGVFIRPSIRLIEPLS